MLTKSLSKRAVAITSTLCLITRVSGQCNPVFPTCPPTLALGTSTYFVDFTQQTNLPPNWTIASYETIDYGSNGAEFTFAKRYDAPYIWTNFHIFYGRVETVVQAAPGTGMISSSVLISDDLDEIDWEWSGNNFGTSTGKVQTNYYGKGITGNYDRGTQPLVNSPQTMFHTYTVDWTPTTLTWSVDGIVVRAMQNNNASSGAYQYPQTPMRVQIGLWDAGDADTSSGTVGWAGGYTDLSKAPFTMYVKSVKITTPNPCSGSWEYADMTGSAGSIKCVSASTSSSSSSKTSASNTSAPLSSNGALTSTSSAAPSTYIVVSGDTGYGIAAKLGILFTSLAAANPAINWDLLLIGQVLKVISNRPTSAVSTSSVISSSTTSTTSVMTANGTSHSATTPSAAPAASVVKSSFNAATISTLTSVSGSTSIKTLIPTGTLNIPSFSGFVYTACNSDNNLGARALNALATNSNLMTVQMCATFCSSYTYMGLEYGRECYCGNVLMSGSASCTDGRCSMACAGNNSQTCGGPYGLSLYKLSNSTGTSQTSSSSGSPTPSMTTKPLATSSTITTGYAIITSTVTTTVYTCTTSSVKLIRALWEGQG